jgi:hypothetical protein
MTPFYGANDPPVGDVVPDWLLGGNRKRRVLAALADEREAGWRVPDLIDDLRCGRSTVYEILRALRTLNVLEEAADNRLRLDHQTDLGEAIVRLLDALAPFTDQPVDRPPRARSRRKSAGRSRRSA